MRSKLAIVFRSFVLRFYISDPTTPITLCSVFFERCRNIFILQQCLTNITMARETDLDQAREYYELMYKNVDVSMNEICFDVISSLSVTNHEM